MDSKDREDQDDFFPAKQQAKKRVPVGDEGEARFQSRSRR